MPQPLPCSKHLSLLPAGLGDAHLHGPSLCPRLKTSLTPLTSGSPSCPDTWTGRFLPVSTSRCLSLTTSRASLSPTGGHACPAAHVVRACWQISTESHGNTREISNRERKKASFIRSIILQKQEWVNRSFRNGSLASLRIENRSSCWGWYSLGPESCVQASPLLLFFFLMV